MNRLVNAIPPAILLLLLPATLQAEQPNIVLIMTDDQGYGDLAAHGNPWIKTPNLDKLAAQSIRLDDYHVSPYCVPSRAALLTGRYADRTGIHNALEPHWFVRTNETLLSEMFKQAGYATGMFGKWHLGDNYPYGAEHRGFDEVLRHYGGAVGVLADYWDNCYVDDTYYHNGQPTRVNGYCTDVFFSAARRFIDRSADQEKPFFIYLATNAPHGPRICPPSYAKAYADGKAKGLATFYGMIANAVLSQRWRLVEGKELYDIDSDPGQNNNVYSKHPKVVQKLTSWYDKLWDELEPTLLDVAEIPLGHPDTDTVTLNYHDCIGRHMFWFQNGIRSLQGSYRGQTFGLIDAASSQRLLAFWPIKVMVDGEYTIELRRYPRELDAAISADIPPGESVYGKRAQRSTKGIGFPVTTAQLSIGGQSQSVEVAKGATAAAFRVKLQKGSQRLSGKFVAADRRSLDSFYVYVRKSE